MQHTYCAIMYLYVVVPCCYPARHSKALGDTNHILSQISTILKAMYASGATWPTLLSIIYLKAFATCRKPRGALLENCQLCHWGLHIFATMRVLKPCWKNRWRHCFLATLVFFFLLSKMFNVYTLCNHWKKWQKKTKQYVWLEHYVWFQHLPSKI